MKKVQRIDALEYEALRILESEEINLNTMVAFYDRVSKKASICFHANRKTRKSCYWDSASRAAQLMKLIRQYAMIACGLDGYQAHALFQGCSATRSAYGL